MTCNLKTFVAAGVLLVSCGPASAAELTFFAGGALRPLLEEALPSFTKATGHVVKSEFGLGSKLRVELGSGRSFDAVLFPQADVDALVAEQKVAAASKTLIMRSSLAVVVQKGAPKPDISSGDALRKALLSAGSIAISAQGPSGLTMMRIIRQMGLEEAVRTKLVLLPPGKSIPDAVAAGAEIGIQQLPEVMGHAGTDIVGVLPDELGANTVFAAGASTTSRDATAAQDLVRWLASNEFSIVLQHRGFLPLK